MPRNPADRSSRHLGLSARTLQRRLHDEETSFGVLLDGGCRHGGVCLIGDTSSTHGRKVVALDKPRKRRLPLVPANHWKSTPERFGPPLALLRATTTIEALERNHERKNGRKQIRRTVGSAQASPTVVRSRDAGPAEMREGLLRRDRLRRECLAGGRVLHLAPETTACLADQDRVLVEPVVSKTTWLSLIVSSPHVWSSCRIVATSGAAQ